MFSKHIFILLLFFTIVFMIAELLNLIDNFTSSFALKSLSIKDLQSILKYRGVNYRGVLEKGDLINLIGETGKTNQYEWEQAKEYEQNEGKCNQSKISIIPNEDLFNELVEDSKDSGWILMTILPKSAVSFSDEHKKKMQDVWCYVQSIYAKYGFNMAVLDCGHLYNLCWDRGFHRSPFVLVLPRGRVKIKDSVDFFVFPYSHELTKGSLDSIKKSVTDWLREKVAHRVNQEFLIENTADQSALLKDFPSHFVSIYSNKSAIQEMPPTSISAHSVKFTGRVHFWSGTINDIPVSFKKIISQKFSNWKTPGHFFINKNDLIYQYGTKKGQSISYDALQLFFRDLCPSSNDIFIWNLLLINLVISFQIVLQTGSVAMRLGYFIWYFLIFNILYGLVFISLLSFLSISQAFGGFLQLSALVWQKIAISPLCEHLRYLQLSNRLNPLLCSVVWLLFVLTIGFLRRGLEPESETPDPTAPNESLPSNRVPEPWDPEAGHQIALLSSLGSFNLTLQQQPPFYLSKLSNWSFRAADWSTKCGGVKMAASSCSSTNTVNDVSKPGRTDDSDLSSDFSSGDVHSGLVAESSPLHSYWPAGYIFTKVCCICLERYRQSDLLCGLPCGHAFHDICIKKWLVQRAKDDCPQCRWPAYKEKP